MGVIARLLTKRISRTLAVFAVGVLSGCVSGEVDVAAGGLHVQQPSFPMPYSTGLQLVMIVGPPGTTDCTASNPVLGAPWRGAVDSGRSVTVTPSPESGVATYKCRVVSAEFPEGRDIIRQVLDVELPIEPHLRERRLVAQREHRRTWCSEREFAASAAGVDCNNIDAMPYEPQQRLQPYIVHVGEPDSEAHARWNRLRERVVERCRTGADSISCHFLTDGTWEALEARDLGPSGADR